jgi:formylglycine-generating enzyme required for sulfatase activity
MLILFLKALAILHVAGLVACVAMLNMDRFDGIKRNLAVGMLVLFASGTGLIFLLEEMQPFIWETAAPAKQKKKKGGGDGAVDTGNSGAGKKKAAKDEPARDQGGDDEAGEEGGEAGEAVSSRRPKDVLQDCPQCPEMVSLAGGTFKMGAMPDEEGAKPGELPQVEGVKIPSFALGRFEVTREQYRAYAKATGQPMRTACSNEASGGAGVSAAKPGFDVNGWHPMVCVTWSDATAYAAWLQKITGKSYRLATAAEWEFAARSGNPYPYQNGTRKISPAEARFEPTAATRGTTPAGSYGPNARGLFDLHGNAAEWVEDCGASSLKDAPKNGKAIIVSGCQRVIKGGGWYSPTEDVRFAARTAVSGGTASNGIGFRVARDFD